MELVSINIILTIKFKLILKLKINMNKKIISIVSIITLWIIGFSIIPSSTAENWLIPLSNIRYQTEWEVVHTYGASIHKQNELVQSEQWENTRFQIKLNWVDKDWNLFNCSGEINEKVYHWVVHIDVFKTCDTSTIKQQTLVNFELIADLDKDWTFWSDMDYSHTWDKYFESFYSKEWYDINIERKDNLYDSSTWKVKDDNLPF